MSLTETNFAVGEAIQPLPISPVQINGAVLRDSRTKALQVDEKVGEHTSLQITLVTPMLDSTSLLNQPLYIRYGSQSSYGYFYGYVNSVSKPQSDTATASQLEVTALGFSSVMKVSPSKVFTKRTTRQILEEVLPSYRIGLAAQDHPFIHQRIAQVGETDWQFVNRVAAMAGFYLYPYSGALVMSNPMVSLTRRGADRVLEKSVQLLDNRPLLEFLPTERTNSTKDDFLPEFTYFTHTGMQSNIPEVAPDKRVKTSDYIYSPEHAQFLIDGIETMTGLYQTASARIRGDAGVRPGMVVNIVTGATMGATDSFDGLWYVNRASTFIDNKVFQTGLTLCRDKYRRPQFSTQPEYLDTNTKRFPTMKLSNDGVWQSSWSN